MTVRAAAKAGERAPKIASASDAMMWHAGSADETQRDWDARRGDGRVEGTNVASGCFLNM